MKKAKLIKETNNEINKPFRK